MSVSKLNEPKWKNDIVKTIWAYNNSGVLKPRFSDQGNLKEGLGEIIHDVRSRCDRCGKSWENARLEHDGINCYQCCWIHSETEDYCPKLCVECHNELQSVREHDTISV